MKPRPIRGSTIIVVGATSGVGKATALSLATHGANLVIVSRTADHVECGGRRMSPRRRISSDRRRRRHQQSRRRRSDRHRGHRHGSVPSTPGSTLRLRSSWARSISKTVTDIEQLIATNVLGTTLASRAAMNHFRTCNAGVLINMSSLLGVVPNPIVPTYSMSKFAVHGLTLSLHQSVWHRSPIRVCAILPGPIDTPMFARAANRSGRAIESDTAVILTGACRRGGHQIGEAATATKNDRCCRRGHRDRTARAAAVYRNLRRPSRSPTHLPTRGRADDSRRPRHRQRSERCWRGLATQPSPSSHRRHGRTPTRTVDAAGRSGGDHVTSRCHTPRPEAGIDVTNGANSVTRRRLVEVPRGILFAAAIGRLLKRLI